jgi:hypothetical protein
VVRYLTAYARFISGRSQDQLRGRREFFNGTEEEEPSAIYIEKKLKRFVVRIGSAPGAGGLVEHVAFFGVRAAPGYHPRGVRQIVIGVNNFGFKSYFVTHMVTITNFGHFPFFLSHKYLQTMITFYARGLSIHSDRRHVY